jgi:hypothetical protein
MDYKPFLLLLLLSVLSMQGGEEPKATQTISIVDRKTTAICSDIERPKGYPGSLQSLQDVTIYVLFSVDENGKTNLLQYRL